MLLSKLEDPVLEALRADGVEAVVSVCGLKRLDLGDGLDRKAVEQIMDEVPFLHDRGEFGRRFGAVVPNLLTTVSTLSAASWSLP